MQNITKERTSYVFTDYSAVNPITARTTSITT